jgi:thioredoxin 1
MRIFLLSLIVLLLGGCSTSSINVSVDEVTELESVVKKGKVVVVDFGAPWCGPCRKLEPEFKKWAENNPKSIWVKVDIDKAPQLAKDYKVEAIPQIIVIKGDNMIRIKVNTEAEIVEAIKTLE